MAYRDQKPSAGVVCNKHGSAPAAATCGRCLQPICDICLGYVGPVPHCYPCAKAARRTATVLRFSALGVVLALVVAGVGYLATRTPPFDYGSQTATVRALSDKVKVERCDRKATIDYEDALVGAGDHRGALADVAAYIGKCGEWYRVHWVAYTAHQRLSEHDLAIKEASLLIAHRPEDADYRWWRGMAHEEAGHLDDAIRDYRETIRINPRTTNIPFNLATLLERQGKRCEALLVVQKFLIEYPRAIDDPGVQARVSRLREGGTCPQDLKR